MIRLNCFFQATDGDQYKDALRAAVALTEKSRHHAGCIAYDVFQSATRSDVFMICETWKDQASLDLHSALQHCFIPTLLDGRYIVYRFLSFLPLTLILCWYYYRKRNPLPIMVGHALIDLATAAQIVATSFIPGLYQTMCGV